MPQNVSANVTCSSNIAKVTWGSSQGAELYSVTASSVNGLSANCTSASTSCDLLTLTCGESYTITVKAKGSNCSSGNSAPVQVQTGNKIYNTIKTQPVYFLFHIMILLKAEECHCSIRKWNQIQSRLLKHINIKEIESRPNGFSCFLCSSALHTKECRAHRGLFLSCFSGIMDIQCRRTAVHSHCAGQQWTLHHLPVCGLAV